jgi:hypothetical protein
MPQKGLQAPHLAPGLQSDLKPPVGHHFLHFDRIQVNDD